MRTSPLTGYRRLLLAGGLLASSLLAAATGQGTAIPLPPDVATSIARTQFPMTIPLSGDSLFVSDPVIIYLDPPAGSAGPGRVGLSVNVQTLHRQPDQSLVASAPGRAELSGELGYDRQTAEILVHRPSIDKLSLDGAQERDSIAREWRERITDPVRVPLPAHPYLLPFRQGIQDISVEQGSVVIRVLYP